MIYTDFIVFKGRDIFKKGEKYEAKDNGGKNRGKIILTVSKYKL
jgi:hypothetical protein